LTEADLPPRAVLYGRLMVDRENTLCKMKPGLVRKVSCAGFFPDSVVLTFVTVTYN
jgi:hypothetical protein